MQYFNALQYILNGSTLLHTATSPQENGRAIQSVLHMPTRHHADKQAWQHGGMTHYPKLAKEEKAYGNLQRRSGFSETEKAIAH
jgi:hypothetical protein